MSRSALRCHHRDVTEDPKSRALDKMKRLAAGPRSLVDFWQQSSEVISSAVPFYDEACWYTVDPASLLITSHYNPNMPALPPEWLAMEYYEADDVNKVGGRRAVATRPTCPWRGCSRARGPGSYSTVPHCSPARTVGSR